MLTTASLTSVALARAAVVAHTQARSEQPQHARTQSREGLKPRWLYAARPPSSHQVQCGSGTSRVNPGAIRDDRHQLGQRRCFELLVTREGHQRRKERADPRELWRACRARARFKFSAADVLLTLCETRRPARDHCWQICRLSSYTTAGLPRHALASPALRIIFSARTSVRSTSSL